MDAIGTYQSIFGNVFNMLAKRGYPKQSFTNDDISKSFKDKQFEHIAYNEQSDSKQLTKIFFVFNSKIKPTGIREYLNTFLGDLDDIETIDCVLFVLPGKVSNSILRVINDVKYKDVPIQFFSSRELIIDITEHSLNPKFSKITNDEYNELAKLYGIENKLMLPIMLGTDPISKFYNFKSGLICKIIRKSPTNIESVSYRLIK